MSRLQLCVLSAAIAASAGCAEEARPLGSALRVTPNPLRFDDTNVGSSRSRTLVVENVSDATLDVDVDVDGPYSAASSKLSIEPGTRETLEVRFAPTEPGPVEGTLRLSTKLLERSESTVVALSGSGIDPEGCRLTLTPDALAFGPVVVGTTRTHELRIENPCPFAVRIRIVEEDNARLVSCRGAATFCVRPERSLEADSGFDLDPGDSTVVEVDFMPVIAGTRERGSFEVFSCDAPTCRDMVRLDGSGVTTGLRVSPTELDFGTVNPGSCTTRALTMANDANGRIEIEGWTVINDQPAPRDAFSSGGEPRTLGSGEATAIDVSFCPDELGPFAGSIVVATDLADPTLRRIAVPLRGAGGGPDVEVFPSDLLDFGLVSTNAPARRTIQITNVGIQVLDITEVVVDTEGTGAFREIGSAVGQLVPGDAAFVTVEFAPNVAAVLESNVLIRTNDRDTPSLTVRVRGEGIELPPCAFAAPSAVEFGDGAPSRMRRRTFTITNEGSTDCLLTGFGLSAGSSPSFQVVDGPDIGRRFAAGESLSTTVEFWSTLPGTETAAIDFSISSPSSTFNTVNLNARVIDDALVVAPSAIDFGVGSFASCRSSDREIRVHNPLAVAVTVNGIAIADSGAPFVLSGLPSLPTTVAPGAVLRFSAAFTGGDGAYASAARIDYSTPTTIRSVYVDLRGETATGASQVDRFDRVGLGPVDVLMVIDVTGCSDNERGAIGAASTALLAYAEAYNVDYQLGITTADTDDEAGRLVHALDRGPFDGPFASRILTPLTRPTPHDAFREAMMISSRGGAAVDESPLEAANLALGLPNITGHNAGFLRRDARLALFVVADEPDQSMGTVEFYRDVMQSVHIDHTDLTASALAGPPPSGCTGPHATAAPAPRLAEMVASTDGEFQPLCATTYEPELRFIGERSFGPRQSYPLTRAPLINSIEVRIDGVIVPNRGPNGTVNWDYWVQSQRVEFAPTALTPGVDIEIRYTVACL